MFSKNKLVGIFAGIVASIGWATLGLWVKNIEMGFLEIAFFRFLISGLLFLLGTGILLMVKKKLVIKSGNIPKAAGLGIIFFLQILTAVYAYKNLSMGQAVVLTNLHIFFMIIFHIISILRSGRLLHHLFATCILFFGIYLIFGLEGNWSFFPALIGVSSSFLFACSSRFSEKLLPEGASGYLGIIFLSGALISLPFASPGVILDISASSIGYLLILCIFSTLIAQFSFLYAIKSAGSLSASILSYLTIIFGVFIDGLQTSFRLNMILGALVVFSAIVYLTVAGQIKARFSSLERRGKKA